MSITWHSFDLRTGRRGPQLSTRELGSVERIIGEATETPVTISVLDQDGNRVRGWNTATLPGRVMLVALDDTDEPVWGGMVYRRRSDASQWVTLDVVTLEAYFDRRFVKDHSYMLTDQAMIAAGVINDAITDGVEFVVDAQVSGTLRQREFADDEDKTVKSVLDELAGVDGGIEYTVDLEWPDTDHTVLSRVVRVRERLGTQGDRPNAGFNMPGNITGFSYVEDYSSDNGANSVVATSSGEGEDRPTSAEFIARGTVDAGWVKFERRFSPSTSITELATLNAHARNELYETWDGMNELTIEANLDAAPKFGRDWFLGDDIGVSIISPRFPERTNADGAVVSGYDAVVRATGVKIDFDARTVSPRLLEARPVDVEEL